MIIIYDKYTQSLFKSKNLLNTINNIYDHQNIFSVFSEDYHSKIHDS